MVVLNEELLAWDRAALILSPEASDRGGPYHPDPAREEKDDSASCLLPSASCSCILRHWAISLIVSLVGSPLKLGCLGELPKFEISRLGKTFLSISRNPSLGPGLIIGVDQCSVDCLEVEVPAGEIGNDPPKSEPVRSLLFSSGEISTKPAWAGSSHPIVPKPTGGPRNVGEPS